MPRRREKQLGLVRGHGGTAIEHSTVHDWPETLRGPELAAQVGCVLTGFRRVCAGDEEDKTQGRDNANEHDTSAAAVR